MDLLTLRTQALLSDVGSDLCGRVGAVRRGSDDDANGHLSPNPGRRGRGDDPLVAGNPDGDLSAGRTGTGDGGLWHRNCVGACAWSHAGRLDYRQLVVALEFLHQY